MTYNNLGNVASYQGDYLRAKTLYEESMTLKQEIGDTKGIGITLHGQGNVARFYEDRALARSLYQQSLAIRSDWGDKPGMADTLEALAHLNQEEGWVLGAARLWGAVERLRAEFGLPIPLQHQAEHAQNIARAQEALGESAFLAAWAEGKAMSLEAALDLAQEAVEGQ